MITTIPSDGGSFPHAELCVGVEDAHFSGPAARVAFGSRQFETNRDWVGEVIALGNLVRSGAVGNRVAGL